MKNFKTFIEAVDKHMVDELKLFIDNDGQLYKQRLVPIVKNIQKKMKSGKYDHKKAPKLWMYLVDDAAKEYVKEFGTTQDDVATMFPKETRQKVAQTISDRELENIKAGEYDVSQGTVS